MNTFNTEDKTESLGFDSLSFLIGQTLNNPEIKNIQSNTLSNSNPSAIQTGFSEIDTKIQGFKKGELVLIAARPGMGKTAFMLSMANNIATRNAKRVALFSLERDGLQLANRLLEKETGVPIVKLRNGNVKETDKDFVQSKIEELSGSDIKVFDNRILTIQNLIEKSRQLVYADLIDVIMIDAVELIANQQKPEEEIHDIKNLALELNIPVIVFTTVTRSVEVRDENKKPLITDLHRDMHTFADTVLMLYRPEYYMINEDKEGNSLKGKAEIIIAKHHVSGEQSVWLSYIEKYASFADLN
ncbi:MAG: DnaB-like helicase C-terminal domain-containing protein [Bacteroidota bacterium]